MSGLFSFVVLVAVFMLAALVWALAFHLFVDAVRHLRHAAVERRHWQRNLRTWRDQ